MHGLREAHTDALAQGEAVAGTLRIAAPYEFGANHLGPVACELMARHAELRVQIDVEHATVNPLEQRYDIVFAMLEGGLPASSIVVRRMFSLERALFAAPALLAMHGEPHGPRDSPRCAAGLLADTEWSFRSAGGVVESVRSARRGSSAATRTCVARRRWPGSAWRASRRRSAATT